MRTVEERNLIRIRYSIKGEFEIESRVFIEEQKKQRMWFPKSLDYNSFVRGFVAGMNFHKRGCTFHEKAEEASS